MTMILEFPLGRIWLLKIAYLCTVRLENGTLEILCRISNHRMLLECILSRAIK